MTETAFSWSVPSRINRILVSFILTVLFSASCQKEAAVTLVGPEGFEISADGSRGATVVFTANRDWTVSCDEPWISFTPSSGPASRDRITLTVHGEANTTHEDRYTGIIITAGEFKKRVTITQPANLEVIASPLSFDLPSATRTITVKAESNIGYDVVIAEDWISHTRTRGLATGTRDFTVSENQTFSPREGKIILKPAAWFPEQVITVRQAGYSVPGKVDLGIVMTRKDGSTYKLFWADRDLGAGKAEEAGNLFAWGETDTKLDYSSGNYKFRTGSSSSHDLFSKYNTLIGYGTVDGKTVLDPEDDAAHVLLGDKWRMPTSEEVQALVKQCSWTRTTRNGTAGFEGKSLVSGNTNSIFFPVVEQGWRDFWSSSLYSREPYSEFCLGFFMDAAYSDDTFVRFIGLNIRPVTE